MSIQAVLLPLFVHVALVFALWAAMAALRARAFSGGLPYEDIALRERKWPARATQVGNAFANQFELPVLFYVLTILAIVTRHADLLFVVMAWIFVSTRLVHGLIHVTTNHVPSRGATYGVGALVLAAMWIVFAVRILFSVR